jgi:hypothetical protein
VLYSKQCRCRSTVARKNSLERKYGFSWFGSSRTMKNSPRQLLLLHQTLQLALYIEAGSILLASAKPRFIRRDCQMVKRDLSQWRRASHHSSRRFTLHMVVLSLCAAARPWKPISLSFGLIVIVLKLFPEAVWNSRVRVATEDR